MTMDSTVNTLLGGSGSSPKPEKRKRPGSPTPKKMRLVKNATLTIEERKYIELLRWSWQYPDALKDQTKQLQAKLHGRLVEDKRKWILAQQKEVVVSVLRTVLNKVHKYPVKSYAEESMEGSAQSAVAKITGLSEDDIRKNYYKKLEKLDMSWIYDREAFLQISSKISEVSHLFIDAAEKTFLDFEERTEESGLPDAEIEFLISEKRESFERYCEEVYICTEGLINTLTKKQS